MVVVGTRLHVTSGSVAVCAGCGCHNVREPAARLAEERNPQGGQGSTGAQTCAPRPAPQGKACAPCPAPQGLARVTTSVSLGLAFPWLFSAGLAQGPVWFEVWAAVRWHGHASAGPALVCPARSPRPGRHGPGPTDPDLVSRRPGINPSWCLVAWSSNRPVQLRPQYFCCSPCRGPRPCPPWQPAPLSYRAAPAGVRSARRRGSAPRAWPAN